MAVPRFQERGAPQSAPVQQPINAAGLLGALDSWASQASTDAAKQRIFQAGEEGAMAGQEAAQGGTTPKVYSGDTLAEQAWNKATRTAYLAGIDNDVDNALHGYATEHPLEPEKFAAKAQALVNGYTSKLDAKTGAMVRQRADDRAGQYHRQIVGAVAKRGLESNIAELLTKNERLGRDISNRLAAGDEIGAMEAQLEQLQTLDAAVTMGHGAGTAAAQKIKAIDRFDEERDYWTVRKAPNVYRAFAEYQKDASVPLERKRAVSDRIKNDLSDSAWGQHAEEQAAEATRKKFHEASRQGIATRLMNGENITDKEMSEDLRMDYMGTEDVTYLRSLRKSIQDAPSESDGEGYLHALIAVHAGTLTPEQILRRTDLSVKDRRELIGKAAEVGKARESADYSQAVSYLGEVFGTGAISSPTIVRQIKAQHAAASEAFFKRDQEYTAQGKRAGLADAIEIAKGYGKTTAEVLANSTISGGEKRYLKMKAEEVFAEMWKEQGQPKKGSPKWNELADSYHLRMNRLAEYRRILQMGGQE